MNCTGPGGKWVKPEVVRIADVSCTEFVHRLGIHELQGLSLHQDLGFCESVFPGLWAPRWERGGQLQLHPGRPGFCSGWSDMLSFSVFGGSCRLHCDMCQSMCASGVDSSGGRPGKHKAHGQSLVPGGSLPAFEGTQAPVQTQFQR